MLQNNLQAMYPIAPPTKLVTGDTTPPTTGKTFLSILTHTRTRTRNRKPLFTLSKKIQNI